MNALHRWFGGPPLATLAKLLFVSLALGVMMAGFGLTPANLLDRLGGAFRSIYGLGFAAVRDVGRYVLTGAIVVVPVWLVLRILGGRK